MLVYVKTLDNNSKIDYNLTISILNETKSLKYIINFTKIVN